MVIFSFFFVGGNMTEAEYQSKLKKKIKSRFPGSIVLKNDPTMVQGIPDLLILFEDRWAALEVKISPTANHQPNQDYYIEVMDAMSFAAFIYPENEEEILDAMADALSRSTRRRSRISRR